MLSHSAIQFIITSNSLATLQHSNKKNIVLHLISAWHGCALPVETASCDRGNLGNGGCRSKVVVDGSCGLENGGCRGNGGRGCVESRLNVDIGLSGNFFMNISFSLGPGLSIFVKSSIVNGGSLDNGGNLSNWGEVVSSSYGGNGDSVTCGSSIPGSSELGFGSLHLRGIS